VIFLGEERVVCATDDSGMDKEIGGSYVGTIKCPDVAEMCTEAATHTCNDDCNGRGSCVDGHCNCHYGYLGDDC
jgi:hypothetical protein